MHPCPFVFYSGTAAAAAADTGNHLWRRGSGGLRGRARRSCRDDYNEYDDEEDEAYDEPHLDIFPPRLFLQLRRLQKRKMHCKSINEITKWIEKKECMLVSMYTSLACS